jgi:hypothetical protein
MGATKTSRVIQGVMRAGLLPWAVLDCPAYARLSHPARDLLMEIARQFVKDNNGRPGSTVKAPKSLRILMKSMT